LLALKTNRRPNESGEAEGQLSLLLTNKILEVERGLRQGSTQMRHCMKLGFISEGVSGLLVSQRVSLHGKQKEIGINKFCPILLVRFRPGLKITLFPQTVAELS
jgi:hypothetical protein